MHEAIGDLVVDRSEPLQVTRQLEAAHHLLAHPRWLVRVFRPVVQPLVLAVFNVDPQMVSSRCWRVEGEAATTFSSAD